MNLEQKLEEWHKTRSIALATEICDELYEEMEAYNEPELD